MVWKEVLETGESLFCEELQRSRLGSESIDGPHGQAYKLV